MIPTKIIEVFKNLSVTLLLLLSVLMPTPSATAVGPTDFVDVPSNHQFYNDIRSMSEQGIVTGWQLPDGRHEFRPQLSVARDATAAFLYRLLDEPEFTPPSVSPFVDVPTDSQFYREISWMHHEGISTGWDIGNGQREFRPLQPVKRDAMSAFFYRIGNEFFSPDGRFDVSPFVDVPTGSRFFQEIAWMADNGISTGWDIGNNNMEFRPLQPVARETMAAFLNRYYLQKKSLTGVSRMDLGDSLTCTKSSFGTVKCAGIGGSVGDGTRVDRTTPQFVRGLLGNVESLFVGGRSACVTMKNAQVRCWGRNDYGQLGTGDRVDRAEPVAVPALRGMSQVSFGADFACGVLNDAVACWGRNDRGQLGTGDQVDQVTPVKVPGLSGYVSPVVGDGFACALKPQGDVKCWGSNARGALGNTANVAGTPMTVVSSDTGRVYAVTANGHNACFAELSTLKCWGADEYGQVGDGDPLSTVDRPEPIVVPGVSEVVTDPETFSPDDRMIPRVGNGFVCVFVLDGDVCWGRNDVGQIGDGTGQTRHDPFRVTDGDFAGPAFVGSSHACSNILSRMLCWGGNSHGQLGLGDTQNKFDVNDPRPTFFNFGYRF